MVSYVVFNTKAVAKTQAVHTFSDILDAIDYQENLNDRYPDKHYVVAEIIDSKSWVGKLVYKIAQWTKNRVG